MKTEEYVLETLKGKLQLVEAYAETAKYKMRASEDDFQRALHEGEYLAYIKIRESLKDSIHIWEE